MPKSTFSLDTVGKCQCPGCPVQSASTCVTGLKKGLSAALAKKPLQKAEIPGAYCATGKATCTDLDAKKGCICATCSVYQKSGLSSGKPGAKFCANGMAV